MTEHILRNSLRSLVLFLLLSSGLVFSGCSGCSDPRSPGDSPDNDTEVVAGDPADTDTEVVASDSPDTDTEVVTSDSPDTNTEVVTSEPGSDSVPLVEITLSITGSVMSVGDELEITAIGTYSNNTTSELSGSAIWSSSDEAVATVDTNGLVTGISAGTTVITATDAVTQLSEDATLVVEAVSLVSIAVTPVGAVIPLGETRRMVARGRYSDSSARKITDSVVWTSSDDTIATVDAAGLVTSVGAGGPVQIVATLGDISGSAPFSVGPQI